jgi:hypothetical protein
MMMINSLEMLGTDPSTPVTKLAEPSYLLLTKSMEKNTVTILLLFNY